MITELVIGYLYPGKPLANVAFKTYGYISMAQALSFLNDFKLGHYMKIPPKSMFIVQVGTLVNSKIYLISFSFFMTWNPSRLCFGKPTTMPARAMFQLSEDSNNRSPGVNHLSQH